MDQPCPCQKTHLPRSVTGFRFARFPPVADDFRPLIEQQRAPGAPDANARKCKEYALSFFDDLAAAQRKLNSLRERVNADDRYGTHIAEIDLIPLDGVTSNPHPRTRHFALHEYEEVELTTRVKHFHAA